MELDHVLVATTDLEAAARELEARSGVVASEGGRHPGWGTANRIVPLGGSYLELVAVVDRAEAADSLFGRWVAAGASDPWRPLGWAVRTNELDAVAQRLALTVSGGSRLAPDGELVEWRSAGIAQAAAEPTLPFFIEWGSATRPPGLDAAAGGLRLVELVLEGDAARLAAWLGDHSLPIVVRAGEPAVVEIVIAGAGREVRIA